MDLRIDRLTLRVAGSSEAQARSLAQTIAEHLAVVRSDAVPGATVPSLRIEVRAGKETADQVALRIRGELIRRLQLHAFD